MNTNMEFMRTQILKMGEGLFIVYGDGVCLNAKKIRKNFTCYQGVTLGSNKGGILSVKDNVTVYTNAVVVGNIHLGDGCSVVREFLQRS